mgnify:CR=1 FL=1
MMMMMAAAAAVVVMINLFVYRLMKVVHQLCDNTEHTQGNLLSLFDTCQWVNILIKYLHNSIDSPS